MVSPDQILWLAFYCQFHLPEFVMASGFQPLRGPDCPLVAAERACLVAKAKAPASFQLTTPACCVQRHPGPAQVAGGCMGLCFALQNQECVGRPSTLSADSWNASLCAWNHAAVAVNAVLAGRSQIGSFVFVGTGAHIIDSVSVSDRITIGAGAAVVHSLNIPGVYVGSPAKRLPAEWAEEVADPTSPCI
jgi:hypothetical protein